MVLKTQSGHAAVLELVIKSFKGAPLIRIPVRQGDIFSLYYIHSVDISPVYEVFAVDAKKGIVLMQSCMKMFGAGFDPWQAHGKIVEEKGWLKMKGLHVPLGSFLLRIGAPTVDHTLKIKGMTLYLSRMMPEKRVWFGISGVNKTENGGSE
jgi:hypothetical protein